MKLTRSNYRLYAAKYYDHPMCLDEAEFRRDLNKTCNIRKCLSHYRSGYLSNVHIIVNYVISFYNVFEHHGATELLFFRLAPEQYEYANAVLMFLSLPTGKGSYNESLYNDLIELFGDV